MTKQIPETKMKTIVISGVNMVDGGIFTVMDHVLSSVSEELGGTWNIIALVNSAKLFNYPNIKYVEFPNIRGSWARRIYFEYVGSYLLSRKLRPDVWLSLHDVSAFVKAKKQYVYCHNAVSFSPIDIRYLRFDIKLFLFYFLYGVLYRINIQANNAVFVQQGWIKKIFENRFRHKNVVVAHPVSDAPGNNIEKIKVGQCLNSWIYPAFPRCFKNVEVIGDALRFMKSKGIATPDIYVTFDKGDGKYADYIYDKYHDIDTLHFIGKQNKSEIAELYNRVDGLIFPSKIETWGLPISESKGLGMPLLVSDLPYAREAVGCYSMVSFFDPNSPQMLADTLERLATGDSSAFETACSTSEIENPLRSWSELVSYIAS